LAIEIEMRQGGIVEVFLGLGLFGCVREGLLVCGGHCVFRGASWITLCSNTHKQAQNASCNIVNDICEA